MNNPYRFPHFHSADGGMLASEMAERLGALDPDYFTREQHDQARILLEEIARQEDANASLREQIAGLTAALRFYAEDDNGCSFADYNTVTGHFGERARAALAALPAPTPAREADARVPMDRFQGDVGRWAEAVFGASTPDSVCAHLADEVVELTADKEPEEAADCLLLLLHLAHKGGYSLTSAAYRKFANNQQRQWGTPDDRGVVRHVARTTAPATEE